MTYDTDKVYALLKALGLVGLDPSNEYERAVLDAAKALKPQPEMEYVLPEWGDYSDGEIAYLPDSNRTRIDRETWDAIREATRRPKQDRVPEANPYSSSLMLCGLNGEKEKAGVPAGADWSMNDVEHLYKVWSSTKGGLHNSMRAVIDAIKSKCGV